MWYYCDVDKVHVWLFGEWKDIRLKTQLQFYTNVVDSVENVGHIFALATSQSRLTIPSRFSYESHFKF